MVILDYFNLAISFVGLGLLIIFIMTLVSSVVLVGLAIALLLKNLLIISLIAAIILVPLLTIKFIRKRAKK